MPRLNFILHQISDESLGVSLTQAIQLALNETYAHRGDANQHLTELTAEKLKGPYNQKDKEFETARRMHHLKMYRPRQKNSAQPS
jgi:hypothetical protein